MGLIKIIKKAVTPIEEKTGHIFDTTNIDNKAENTYSANIIDELVKDVYSTEETVVGTWIDGKPIYRKVIQASDLIAGIGNQIPTGIENLDIVVDINGTVNNSEYFQGTSKAHLKSFDFQIGTSYNKSTNCVEIDVGANLSGYSANIILEYTKTTD